MDAEGVPVLVNIALKHLESERDHLHTAVEVLNIYRQVTFVFLKLINLENNFLAQIVAGVEYTVILKVAPTTCLKQTLLVSPSTCPINTNAPVEYCKIKYLQQPWISKASNIIYNNCTVSQQFTVMEDPVNNSIGKDVSKEMSEKRLEDMEAQVIPQISDPFKAYIDDYFGEPSAVTAPQPFNNEVQNPVANTNYAKTTPAVAISKDESSEESKEESSESSEESAETNETKVSSQAIVVKQRESEISKTTDAINPQISSASPGIFFLHII